MSLLVFNFYSNLFDYSHNNMYMLNFMNTPSVAYCSKN